MQNIIINDQMLSIYDDEQTLLRLFNQDDVLDAKTNATNETISIRTSEQSYTIDFSDVKAIDERSFESGFTFTPSFGDLIVQTETTFAAFVATFDARSKFICSIDASQILSEEQGPTTAITYLPSSFDWSTEVNTLSGHVIITYAANLATETVNLPVDVTLEFRQGSFTNGELVGADTTIINTSNAPIFDSSMTFNGTWKTTGVFLEWFGATGLGFGYDDTIPLQQAGDFARDFALKLTCEENKDFAFYSDVDWFGIQFIDMPSRLRGNAVEKVLEVGWDSEDDNAVQHSFENVFTSVLKYTGGKNGTVYIGKAMELFLYANTNVVDKQAIAFMNFSGGKIDMVRIDNIGAGWVNENHFRIDRIISLEILSQTPLQANHNIFYSPSLEGGGFYINNGSDNVFYSARFEGATSIDFSANALNNIVIVTRTAEESDFLASRLPDYTDDGINNKLVFLNELGLINKTLIDVNASSENYDVTDFYRNGSNITIANNWKNIYVSGLIRYDQDMGFHFRVEGATPDLFRFYVEIYDETKTQIVEGAEAGQINDGSMPWDNTSKYNNTVNSQERSFMLRKQTTTAKYVKVFVRCGGSTAGSSFDSIVVTAKYNSAAPISFPAGAEPDITRLTSNIKPVLGTWSSNDIVWNEAPTSQNESMGWICLASGTPGTWKEFGQIDTNKTYTVATKPSGPVVGSRIIVTDALTPTFQGILVGGGAVTCQAIYNGTDWRT